MNESIDPAQIAKQAKSQKKIFSKAEDFLALTLNSEKSYEVFVSEFEILAGRLKPSKANSGLKKYYLHQLVNILVRQLRKLQFCSPIDRLLRDFQG